MPIEFAAPPAPAIATLNEVLPMIAQTPSFGQHLPNLASGVQRVAPADEGKREVKPFFSAPVHILGAKDVATGSDVSALAATSWTHMLSGEAATDQPVVTADTSAKTSAFETLKQGPVASTFRRELEGLSQAPNLSSGSYELAVLRVPALHIECFWLKGKAGHQDVLIPFTRHNTLVEAGRQYSMQEFLQAIKPAAEEILRQDADDKGG